MNNVNPRITLNLYEMCFPPPLPAPSRIFKKENIDSGGVQRFKALGEPPLRSMPALGGRPCPVLSPPWLAATGCGCHPSPPRVLVRADEAGAGGRVMFAAGSRCCRSPEPVLARQAPC